jgi:hypothetical protein
MVRTFVGIGDFQEDGPEFFGVHQGSDHGPQGVQVVPVLHSIRAGIAAIQHVEAGCLDQKGGGWSPGVAEGKSLDRHRRARDGICLSRLQALIGILP